MSNGKPLAEIIADEVMDTIERERRINRDDLIAAVERKLPVRPGTKHVVTVGSKVSRDDLDALLKHGGPDRKTDDELLSDMVCYGSAVAIVEKDEENATHHIARVGGADTFTIARKTDDELRADVFAPYHQLAKEQESKERAAMWKRLKETVDPPLVARSTFPWATPSSRLDPREKYSFDSGQKEQTAVVYRVAKLPED